MIAMPNPSFRARAKRAYGDFIEMINDHLYRRGFMHAMVVVALVLSLLISIPFGVMVSAMQAHSTTAPVGQTALYYLLNDDGTIKATVGDKPEGGSYFQDEERFNKKVTLGRDTTTFTSPDGASHTINAIIIGTMNRETRVKMYNRLVRNGSMEPIEAGTYILSLTEELSRVLVNTDPNYGIGEVTPILSSYGEKYLTIGSDDLLQRFRAGAEPEAAYSNGEVAAYNFACEKIRIGFGNNVSEYDNDLTQRYPDFSDTYAKLDTASVLSNTAEPCGVTVMANDNPPMEAPPLPEDYDTYSDYYSENGVLHYEP